MTALDREAAYYQSVEEFFVSRRGDPLLLSNADWLLVKRWRSQGLPLRVVLRGIADALDAHAHSWGRRRKVGSLRYCEAEVERARERWERATADGAASDVAGGLEALSAALERARGLGPAAAPVARDAAARLRRLREGSRPRDAEPELQVAEGALVAAIRADDPDGAERLDATVDAALAAYRSRMPAKVFASLREQSIRRELLARHGLPRLTLFEI
ncbi:MAG TPA: hypothetical protein VFM88_15090 [Vicinamibacteria bacterium]|nr:hypothetical protein [Vicinamibacteria bacterium]